MESEGGGGWVGFGGHDKCMLATMKGAEFPGKASNQGGRNAVSVKAEFNTNGLRLPHALTHTLPLFSSFSRNQSPP